MWIFYGRLTISARGKLPVTQADRTFDTYLAEPRFAIVASWEADVHAGDVKTRVTYVKMTSESAVVQIVSANKIRRQWYVDSDRDGNIDYNLIDSTGDGRPDFKFQYSAPFPMIDWPRSAAS